MDLKVKGTKVRAMIHDFGFKTINDKNAVRCVFNIIDLKGLTLSEFDEAVKNNDMEKLKPINLSDESLQVEWMGWLTDAAREFTVKTLVTLGATDAEKLADGIGGVNAARAYELVMGEPHEGYAKVAFVNIPGQGGGFGKTLSRSDAMAAIAKAGLAGELAKAAQGQPTGAVANKAAF